MTSDQIGTRFCRLVGHRSDMSPQAAKVGAWLIGLSCQTARGFPVEVTSREIEFGVYRDGLSHEGVGLHKRTIKTALEWLEEQTIISIDLGTPRGNGFTKLISFRL